MNDSICSTIMIINWFNHDYIRLFLSCYNYIFTISQEGYLFIIEKQSGNIIKITDVFSHFKPKKREKIEPVGFVMGLKKYLFNNK